MQHMNLFDAYHRGMGTIFHFLGLIGKWILGYPNGVFYILLFLGCLFIPYLAVFLVVCLLSCSWLFGGDYAR